MDLSDIVTISITAATRTPSQAGFGVPLITSFTATWTERTRTYSKASDVLADFATTTPEYKAAAAMFSQNPCPPKVVIGRCALKPTQQWHGTITAKDLTKYRLVVNGREALSVASDGSASVTEIIVLIKAAIDALSITGMTVSDDSSVLKIIMTNGLWASVGCTDVNISLVQDQADPGIATDLAAIKAENNEWYALCTTFNSQAIIKEAAAWALANKKLYVVQTQDNTVPNTAISGTDDVAEYLKNAANGRVSVWYSSDNSDFLDAALLGRLLPKQPGSEQWAFKTLAGVPAGAYTPTQRTNILAKTANFYEPTAGINITWDGRVSSTEFIDVVRFIDWFEARLAEAYFTGQINVDKIEFDAFGLQVVKGLIEPVFKQASQKPIRGITADYTIFLPDMADISVGDRASRTLNGVEFAAKLTGAILKANLQGTLSV
jgi:hypothetical protein